MSVRAENRRAAQAEAAAALFRQGYSYRWIARQLGITVSQAEAKVKAALGESPRRVRQALADGSQGEKEHG